MAVRVSDREYELAWAFLQSVLLEAAGEPSRVKAREEFLRRISTDEMIIARNQRAGISAFRRTAHIAAQALTSLDAFAIACGSGEQLSAESFEILGLIRGHALRVFRWVRAWRGCRANWDRGRLAAVTIRLLREEDSAAAVASACLQTHAERARDRGDRTAAFRLSLGSRLCAGRVSTRQINQLADRLLPTDSEEAADERRIGLATAKSVNGSPPYVVVLNRLDRHADRSGSRSAQQQSFQKTTFANRGELDAYIHDSIHIQTYRRLHNAVAGKTTVHVCLDFVGVHTMDAPVVYSYRRKDGNPVRCKAESPEYHEWLDDLTRFLALDLANTPPTVGDMIRWRLPTYGDPDEWLQQDQRGGKDVPSLHREIVKDLGNIRSPTVVSLENALNEALVSVRAWRKARKYNRRRQVYGWCQSINRQVMGDKAKGRMVRLPSTKGMTATRKIVCEKLNYISIDDTLSPYGWR